MTPVERGDPLQESQLVDLIRRAQANADPAAFDGLYLLYADRIFRYLLVRTADVETAEEAVSQTFVRLIEKVHLYQVAPQDNVAIFSAWLYRMAYNGMIDLLRRQQRTRHLPIDDAPLVAHGQVSEQVEGRLAFQEVLDKLQLLNDQQRQVVMLRFLEEHSVADTARIMQKTEGAVKALQHRALAALRSFLQP
jgi:RNA polymerase sigma-70 factor (ECF subfamily)